MNRIALAAVLLAAPLWSASRPNFTGTWRLDPLRSRMDQKVESKTLVLKIEHNDPALRITISDPKDKQAGGVLDLTTDGAEHTCTVDGQPAKATAQWDPARENRLLLTVTKASGGTPQTVTRELKLGDKGRIITTVLDVHGGAADMHAYEFFVKE